MTTVIILIILFLIWLIFRAKIKAWIGAAINRFIANRTEDFIRRAAGMPPREKRRHTSRSSSRGSTRTESRSRSSSHSHSNSPIIPPEYAEDVEFTEIKEFSQTDIDARFQDGSKVEYHESQVSDVEWVEIKNSDRKRRS